MSRVAVTALGADRPGIVAAVTGVLMQHGGNLEDTAMTNLGGHFAMMLVVDVPSDESAEALESALVEEVADMGLTVAVRPLVGAPEPTRRDSSGWALSLYGADRPGIVHHVAKLLADHGANIVDLSTRVVGAVPEQAYVLLLELELPRDADVDRLRMELAELAADMGVDAHLHSDDPDVL
jgi:glycine cleavage system transcriptional repressor